MLESQQSLNAGSRASSVSIFRSCECLCPGANAYSSPLAHFAAITSSLSAVAGLLWAASLSLEVFIAGIQPQSAAHEGLHSEPRAALRAAQPARLLERPVLPVSIPKPQPLGQPVLPLARDHPVLINLDDYSNATLSAAQNSSLLHALTLNRTAQRAEVQKLAAELHTRLCPAINASHPKVVAVIGNDRLTREQRIAANRADLIIRWTLIVWCSDLSCICCCQHMGITCQLALGDIKSCELQTDSVQAHGPSQASRSASPLMQHWVMSVGCDPAYAASGKPPPVRHDTSCLQMRKTFMVNQDIPGAAAPAELTAALQKKGGKWLTWDSGSRMLKLWRAPRCNGPLCTQVPWWPAEPRNVWIIAHQRRLEAAAGP